ncbi:MAG: DMT family transporter [Blastocatellia bacterium]|nr:DMT family transporter [Blastocatellia bacterium]
MSERARGIVCVLLAAMLWSGGGLGIKLVQSEALAISGYRSFFALPLLFWWLAVSSQGKPGAVTANLKRPFLWAAAGCYAVTVVCFVIATKLTTAANTILLQSTAPIYVALLSWPFLRERVRTYDWLAIAGCLLGMTFFFRDKLTAAGLTGNCVALLAGLCFAGLPISLRLDQLQMQKQEAPAGYSPHLSAVFAVTIGNLLAVVPGLPAMVTQPPQTGIGWVVLILLGTVQIGVAYLFFTAGVGKLQAIETSLLTLLEPILNPLWVALFVHELPSRSAIIGGGMILGSMAVRGVLQSVKKPVPMQSSLAVSQIDKAGQSEL